MLSPTASESLFFTSQNRLKLRWVFGLSCLLSLWLINLDPIINRDGIIYLRTADAYLQSGFLAGQALFDRPALPVLFALIHSLTGLPLHWAGQLVVTLFYGLLATGFVSTVRLMGGDRRVQLLAAAVILSHPILNAARSSIMRDPAYWAMIMLAFRELVQYARSPVLKHQIRWLLYISLASMFRFEGLFFAALAPLSMFFIVDKQVRWQATVRLMALPLVAIGGLCALVIAYQAYSGDRLFTHINAYVLEFSEMIKQFGTVMAAPTESWLEHHSHEDASAAAIGGLSAVLLFNIIRALTWPYVGVLVWGWVHDLQERVRPRDHKLIGFHILISLFYLLLFLITKRFMLERYSGIVTLFLLLYLPFVLSSLWANGKKYGSKLLVILLLTGMTLDSLHNGDYKKAYIREAAQWVEQTTPEESSIVTNSSYIAYFSGRNFDWGQGSRKTYVFTVDDLDRQPGRWRRKDYLIMALKPRQRENWQAFMEKNALEEIKHFHGKERGFVSIVKVRPGKSSHRAAPGNAGRKGNGQRRLPQRQLPGRKSQW